ncbi:hypothetical protein FRB99_008358 [Tulasnella sp. 403]|nr:hypothetical protein FRB99_008358 [Tulasnella sp. 403]
MKDYSWGPGWGLEILESAKPKELVSVYLGDSMNALPDITFRKEGEWRYMIATYLHRNYMFSMTKDREIDSSRAANETRFINHSSDAPNLSAEVRWVCGEPRIAFFASRYIKAGEELLFDYGPKFWPKGSG